MIIDELKADVIRKSANTPDDLFTLHGLWHLNLLFKPNAQERLFEYIVIVAQTLNQGCCYTEEDPILDNSLVGQDARQIKSPYRSVEIAILDAVYSVFVKQPVESFILDGTSLEKSKQRAKIICNEVAFQLGTPSSLDGKKIVNIGAVGNIIKELKDRGATVFATDRDPKLINSSVCDVKVENCNMNENIIQDCDLALVTGMTLSTGTLDAITLQCKPSGVKLIIFAETGANFAEEYCKFGVDAVISEPFPFYIFSGMSKIEVYRSARSKLSRQFQ